MGKEQPQKKLRNFRILRGENLRLAVNIVLASAIVVALPKAFPVKRIKARMGQHYSLEKHERSLKRTLAKAYIQRGKKFYAEDNMADASKMFAKLIEVNPQFAPAYYRLAQIQIVQGQHEQARKNLNEAIKRQPNFAEAYLHLGKSLAATANISEAIPPLKKSILLNQSLREAFLILGNCYASLNEYEKALDTFRKGAKTYPDEPEMFRRVAETLETINKGALD